MDEAMVRKRVTEILQKVYGRDTAFVPTTTELSIYRAAYADGLEAAAKIAGSPLGPALCDFDDHWGPKIANAIRQHAKEMGHEQR